MRMFDFLFSYVFLVFYLFFGSTFCSDYRAYRKRIAQIKRCFWYGHDLVDDLPEFYRGRLRCHACEHLYTAGTPFIESVTLAEFCEIQRGFMKQLNTLKCSCGTDEHWDVTEQGDGVQLKCSSCGRVYTVALSLDEDGRGHCDPLTICAHCGKTLEYHQKYEWKADYFEPVKECGVIV